jgi:predicted KAP-like P-loop ATPase
MMAQIAIKLLLKLATETFISKMVVHGLRALSKSTENDIDDKVVKDVAQALGVPE